MMRNYSFFTTYQIKKIKNHRQSGFYFEKNERNRQYCCYNRKINNNKELPRRFPITLKTV